MASITDLTPQERLAISRKAIVRHMNRHHPLPGGHEEVDRYAPEADDPYEVDRARSQDPVGTLGRLRYAARVWWHRHPASAAVELAQPVLRSYARAHPFKLLGAAAVAGAAVALVRPWRMVSASAVAMAAVKSSGVTNTLISMIASMTGQPDTTDS